jgi:hypothetical protein
MWRGILLFLGIFISFFLSSIAAFETITLRTASKMAQRYSLHPKTGRASDINSLAFRRWAQSVEANFDDLGGVSVQTITTSVKDHHSVTTSGGTLDITPRGVGGYLKEFATQEPTRCVRSGSGSDVRYRIALPFNELSFPNTKRWIDYKLVTVDKRWVSRRLEDTKKLHDVKQEVICARAATIDAQSELRLLHDKCAEQKKQIGALSAEQKKQIGALSSKNLELQQALGVSKGNEATLVAALRATKGPSSFSVTPPPTRSTRFKLAIRRCFTIVPTLPQRTFTRLFTTIVYFAALELGLTIPLKTVVALAPTYQSITNWTRWGAAIDDYLLSQELARSRGVLIATDAGQAAKLKRQMTAIFWWDFLENFPCFRPLDAMVAASGGKGAASNVTASLNRVHAKICFGGTTDSSPDVLSVMPVHMKGTWPDYKIVIGCVLHILNIIFCVASVNTFGDEAMGVCGALRLAYVVNYLMKKYTKEWVDFCEERNAPTEFKAIVPRGEKGRWWSLQVAWGCIARDPLLYSDFFMMKANDTTISETYRSMLRETSAWLVTPKALAQIHFHLNFSFTWWIPEMEYAQGFPQYMDSYPPGRKIPGLLAAEYSVRVVTSHLRLCAIDPATDSHFESFRAACELLNKQELYESKQETAMFLTTTVVMKEKHHVRWLKENADLSVGYPDLILRAHIAARFIARYDEHPDPSIEAGEVVVLWGKTYGVKVIVDHLTQFIDANLLRERSALMSDDSFVDSMRVALAFKFNEADSGPGGALYYAMVKAIALSATTTTHSIEKLVQTANLFTMPYSSMEGEDRVANLLVARVETQDDWRAAVAQLYANELTPEVIQDAKKRALLFRPGSFPLVKPAHRVNNKTTVEVSITMFEKRVALVTEEVVTAAKISAAETEAAGHSRHAFARKRDTKSLEDSAAAVLKSGSNKRSFDGAARAKQAQQSAPVQPKSLSGMLYLDAKKSADFGADYSRATLIAECEVREIPLQRKENNDVKTTVTMDDMKGFLSNHHQGSRVIPRMTVDGCAPRATFVGTKRWAAPPPPAPVKTTGLSSHIPVENPQTCIEIDGAPSPGELQAMSKKQRARANIRRPLFLNSLVGFHAVLLEGSTATKARKRAQRKSKK